MRLLAQAARIRTLCLQRLSELVVQYPRLFSDSSAGKLMQITEGGSEMNVPTETVHTLGSALRHILTVPLLPLLPSLPASITGSKKLLLC